MEENKRFKYHMVSIGIMHKQINLRLSNNLLASAHTYAKEHGFWNIQEFIKETVREKLFDEPEITQQEVNLVKKLAEVTEKKSLYGSEDELFRKLRRK